MLLDTMCNTFGGVCFIALLVAILSAMVPKTTVSATELEQDTGRMVENERLAQLRMRRDELRQAATLLEDLLSASSTNETITVTEAEIAAEIAAKADAITELRKKLKGMEEEIARLATSEEYNKAEAARLRKLADELRDELEKAELERRRIVRTPMEREVAGLEPFDLWIRDNHVYVVNDSSQCRCEERGFGNSREWRYTVIHGRGSLVDPAFFGGAAFSSIVRRLGGMRYARIHCDSNSFSALCLLRDDLVRRELRYNWYVCDKDELTFVFGTDSKVQ